MAPLLVSALVGIGVKIATDLFMSGAKQVFRQSTPATSPATSFAATLDKASAATPPAGGPTAARLATLDTGFGDRSRVLTADATAALSAPARTDGVAIYRRLDEIPPQAV
jgi:hypothetical protein